MANCGRVGCCGNVPTEIKPGDVVAWTEVDVQARHQPCDRPYARAARGIVEGVYNGGWSVKVQWRRAVTVVDVRRVPRGLPVSR